jgi:hypothetical protein
LPNSLKDALNIAPAERADTVLSRGELRNRARPFAAIQRLESMVAIAVGQFPTARSHTDPLCDLHLLKPFDRQRRRAEAISLAGVALATNQVLQTPAVRGLTTAYGPAKVM